MSLAASSRSLPKLARLVAWSLTALAIKILVVLLLEYRLYFPANFDAVFLLGREKLFAGIYRLSFYTHILTGPICILLAGVLIYSGPRLPSSTNRSAASVHRIAGRLQAVLVLVFLVPTGIVMSRHALAGPVASAGFFALSLSTAATMLMTIGTAIRGNLTAHRRWAIRCFILLLSPLALRFIAGVVVVLQMESDRSYQLNAWLSWLAPIAAYELARIGSGCQRQRKTTMLNQSVFAKPISTVHTEYLK